MIEQALILGDDGIRIAQRIVDLDDRTDVTHLFAAADTAARTGALDRSGLQPRKISPIEHRFNGRALARSHHLDANIGAPMSLDMVQVARRVLEDNGFVPDFPDNIESSIPATEPDEGPRDMRQLAWSSIDNQESRDLDQIEVAERLPDGSIRVLVGIADVDALVPKGSPIDRFAATNTTSLYTGVHTFPMLPLALSTDRTSLLEDGRDRLAVITEIVVRADGSLDDTKTAIYIARVANQAKLVYEDVGAWLDGAGAAPHGGAPIAAQLKLQDEAAQKLRALRHEHGALDLETIEARPIVKDGQVVDLEVQQKNRARQLIEDVMIAANGATARFLEARGLSSMRRVVAKPKRWDRIIELAGTFGVKLPVEPDAKALSDFLAAQRAKDPTRFADLSLSVVKLLGPGQYVLQRAQDRDQGHFGLAVDDYAHSTAPNRRYPDLITQRLLKAVVRGGAPAYTDDELTAIAEHCTERENAARKVERTMRKIAAASLLSSRIGDVFDAIITGVTDKGTFARLLSPPAEGRLVRGDGGVDVGDRVRVKLVATEPEKGFIDFVRL
jgi:VacB/RNase II family 3'-5' exoribonuclease